jgi:hypothetical protein
MISRPRCDLLHTGTSAAAALLPCTIVARKKPAGPGRGSGVASATWRPVRAEEQMSIELTLGVFLAFTLGYALRAYMSYRRRHYR